MLWGGISVGDPGMKEALAVDDPAAYAAQLFRMMLERRGIQVTGSTHALHADLAQFFDKPNAPGANQNGAGDTPRPLMMEARRHRLPPLLQPARKRPRPAPRPRLRFWPNILPSPDRRRKGDQ